MKEGWRNAKLGEAFKTVTGSTPSKRKTDFYGDDVPLIKPPELEDSEIVNYSDHLSVLGAKEARLLPERSVLVSCIGNLGKIGITNCVCASNQQINAILPNYSVALPEFIFYQTLSPNFKEQLEDLATGTTLSIVNKTKFNRISIPVPPLPEQEAIVEILDQAFAAIDQAKANIEQNITNAKELFQSKLNQIFSQKSNGWVKTTLDNICKFQNGFAFKSAKFKSTGTPILRISNIQEGEIDLRKIVYTDPRDYSEDLAKYHVGEGALLIAMSGATTGKIGINHTDQTFLLNQRVGKFIPGEELHKQFLYYFLFTQSKENLRISAGAAQPNLSTAQIKNFQIPLPSLEVQKEVVKKLNYLDADLDNLLTTYQTKLTALEELKKSILQKAFAGDLT